MINNSYRPLWDLRGTTVHRWGKDQTGTVSYTINSQGFRGNVDYDWSPDYAFFGCSSVFGIGLDINDTMVTQFSNAQNYGLAGISYLNAHSLENLQNFVSSPLYQNTQIVFFWIERPGQEDIQQLIDKANGVCNNILHISHGNKYIGARNLMRPVDFGVSGTHGGVKTHKIWAKTIQQCLKLLS